MISRPSPDMHDRARVAGAARASAAADTEVFVLRGETREALVSRIDELARRLSADSHVDDGHVDWKRLAGELSRDLNDGGVRLAIVATSLDDLRAKLARAAERLADAACQKIRDVTGIYFTAEPFYGRGKITFLFPGEGAQYLGMARDLLPWSTDLGDALAYCDEVAARPDMKISSPRRFIAFAKDASAAEREMAERELRRLGNAIFSVLITDIALFQMLARLGLTPDMLAGHSAGELAAVAAAGCILDERSIAARIVHTMQSLDDMETEAEVEPAVLLAVGAAREKVKALLDEAADPRAAQTPAESEFEPCGAESRAAVGAGDAFVAMDNCPHQTVVVGCGAAMAAVEERLKRDGHVYERLTLSRAYHTPLFEPYLGPLAEMLDHIEFQRPSRQVYSCTTAEPFPSDPAEIRQLTLAHWFSPVEFTHMVRNMHDAGARLFVEVGPRGNLTSFVEDILRGREFLAIPVDVPHRGGIAQLHRLIAQLAAHGVPVRWDVLPGRCGASPSPLPADPAAEREEPAVAAAAAASTADEVGAAAGASPLVDAPSSRAPAMLAPAAFAHSASEQRASVVAGHLAVMERFLDDQQAVMEQFLAVRRSGLRPVRRRRVARLPSPAHGSPHTQALVAWQGPPENDTSPSPPFGSSSPLLGEIVRHDPGREVVTRRRLDLDEDRFAADHTVGGRMVSKVHPNHYGLPIGPMTFTLEMMAETAALLAPGAVAVEIKDVRLFRWLPYYEGAPYEVCATAKRIDPTGAETADAIEVEVQIAVVDNGNLLAGESAGAAAVGRVVLASRYPAAPKAEPFALTGRRPCRITLDGLYHDLFHGPLFMGVTALTAIGDEGIEGRAVVLPRKGLFKSTDDPAFLLDPVLMDVVMHPLCAWHLEQPDLAGRTLLPFELKSLRIYGARPAEGACFEVRGRMVESSPRHFMHEVEAIDDRGCVWCRLTIKYWRFYMPFGDVNFHGRKDEYFISVPWREAIGLDGAAKPAGPRDERDRRLGDRDALLERRTRAVCMRLDPPVDLHQPAMQMVTAQITLSADELRAYRRMDGPAPARFDWVFSRLAAKDAVRQMWWERHGERFFPADLELKHDASGRMYAEHLGHARDCAMPRVSLACDNGVVVALASFEPYVGIALATVDARSDRSESAIRLSCALEAVAKALGRDAGDSESTIDVPPRAGVDADGWLDVQLSGALAAEHPDLAAKPLRVWTSRYKKWIVAATLYEAS